MSWKSRPLSAKCVSWRRISASGSSVPRRRSPPADSTNWTYGSRFSREISSARLIFFSETAVMAPPSTVGSWPQTTHSTPETTPMPETNPPPTLKSVPQPASGLSSRKGASRSSKSSMRSRMRSLPRSRCRATLRSPPPARASASWASTSARRASMSCRFRRKPSEPVSTRDRTTSMSVRAMMTARPAAVNPAALTPSQSMKERVLTRRATSTAWLRGDWSSSRSAASFCGASTGVRRSRMTATAPRPFNERRDDQRLSTADSQLACLAPRITWRRRAQRGGCPTATPLRGLARMSGDFIAAPIEVRDNVRSSCRRQP